MEALDIPRLRGVTHAYAFWLALVAAAGLVLLTPAGSARVAAGIYGFGLCALFGASGLYHRWRWHPRWRPLLRRIDHATIYLFMAASYTPVGMLVLSGTLRWAVLITVWAGALLGVAFSVAWISAPRALCSATYVALGWVAVFAFPQLVASLPLAAVALIVAGGLLYTAGAVVFAVGRPNPWPRVFGFHEIFHVFVILAAIAHFVAMAAWIVPSGLGD
ncbi:MAG TPA: hemolysin III family protein [Solirubrobacter sp.]|nr:hemolysin III family protein [Solirubrobacter sp.]